MTLAKKILLGSVIAAAIGGITYAAGYVTDTALLGIVTAINTVLAATQAYIQSRPTT